MPSLINLLKDVDPKALSIVPSGANGQRIFLFKADGDAGSLELPPGRILKADDWSAFYIVVAEPGREEKPGLTGDPTTLDVWESEDEIRKAAWRFMKNGALVNKLHEDMEPYGTLVENAIAHQDFQVGSDTIRKGSWYVAIEPTDEGKQKVDSGEFGGVSIQGDGVRVEKEADESTDGLLRRVLNKLLAESEDATDDTYYVELSKREFSPDQRKKLASTGAAMSGGRFPIENCGDVSNAVQAIGRAKGDPSVVKRHIISRAKSLGCTGKIPDSWGLAKDAGTVETTNEETAVELSERVDQIETTMKEQGEKLNGIEEAVKPIGESLEKITKKLDEKSKAEKEAELSKDPEALAKKIEEIAEGQGIVANALIGATEALEKMQESDSKPSGSRQVDENDDSEKVAKSDGKHPLAGLLS